MIIEGYLILTLDQVQQWKEYDLDEYEFFVDQGLFDEENRFLWDFPEWMFNADDSDGPFDFGLHPSQATWGD